MNQRYVLKKNEDIEKLVAKRKSVGSKFYAIFYSKSENDDIKIAVSISKKCGCSPLRNYEKRVTREIIRTKYMDKLNGYTCLVVIKKDVVNLTFEQKCKELDYVFRKMFKNQLQEENK